MTNRLAAAGKVRHVILRPRIWRRVSEFCITGGAGGTRISLMDDLVGYNPLEVPEPDEWLAIDEAQRIDLVLDYHRRARVRLPNEKLHAILHVVIENQIALGDEIPVQNTVQRLMAEDLDRHEAIHCIASVLAEFIHDLVGNPGSSTKSNQAYFAALQQLTAEGWLSH
jgi:Domain of unknown function (DUF1841)